MLGALQSAFRELAFLRQGGDALSVQLSFRGLSEYNSGMLEKVAHEDSYLY
jgi:hypothetical protein